MLALTAGCSDPAPSDEPPTGAEVQESPAPEETPDPAESETPNESGPSEKSPSAGPLSITIGSDAVDFAPTDVYCKVGGGELRHLIAKTNNQPPLLEVTSGEFAMLKLEQRGAPEKNSNPSRIEYHADGVVFSDATIGDATLDGALQCTETEGK